MNDRLDFDSLFRLVTGHDPFPWQKTLFTAFCAEELPDTCSIPTGMGKTNVLAVWLLALAEHINQFGCASKFPRRLVYVVNRRTVVDQTTTEAERLRDKLQSDDPQIQNLRSLLAQLCTDPEADVLAISTLRGQHADNEQWQRDPARAAIILGTVDMIGYKLAFQGYGCGYKSRPLHAALLGQDVLLVHDEAHLEPAFETFSETVKKFQVKESRIFHVMSLTASPRKKGPLVHMLTEADRQNEVIRKRLTANKILRLHPVSEKKDIPSAVLGKALGYRDSGQAILIYLDTVDDVLFVKKGLSNQGLPVQVLTGTLRGWERDLLALQDPIFARFLVEPQLSKEHHRTGTVYLVCTSAGEVGVNLSGDHMICDLVTLDRLLQRGGRVNRLGEGEEAYIDVYYCLRKKVVKEDDGVPKKKTPVKAKTTLSTEDAVQNTQELLRRLPSLGDGSYSASPESFQWLLDEGITEEENKNAFTQHGNIPVITDILLDLWSQTTIRDKAIPPVARYLHGDETNFFNTTFAWREDVDFFNQEEVDEEDTGVSLKRRQKYSDEEFQQLLNLRPLQPQELLPDSNFKRVSDQLKALWKPIKVKGSMKPRCPLEMPVWVWSSDTTITTLTLADIKEKHEEQEKANTKNPKEGPLFLLLCENTLVLPPSAGGLTEEGFFCGSEKYVSSRLYDVSGIAIDKGKVKESIIITTRPRQICSSPDAVARFEKENSGFRTLKQIECSDGYWVWLVKTGNRQKQPWQSLPFHQERVTHYLKGYLKRVGISEDTPEHRSLLAASPHHDDGKDYAPWQRYIGNIGYKTPESTDRDPKGVWAKPKVGCNVSKQPIGYRHEYGSMKGLLTNPDFLTYSSENQDLILQVIGAHHGRNRPCFQAKEIPGVLIEGLPQLALDAPQRFARLQKKYGFWGLAYLESLLRIADRVGSGEEEIDD